MEIRLAKSLLSVWVSGTFLLIFSACVETRSPVVESVTTKEKFVIAQKTYLPEITITEGTEIKAPEGYSLTMTVDGIETEIAPGTYIGNVVLTPSENIPHEFSGFGLTKTYYLRTGIYVNDSAFIPKKSVLSAIVGGEVTDNFAKNISITSRGDEFNGIIVTGDSTYAVKNLTIDFSGFGGNDFVGIGAAIMTDGNATLTVDNAEIVTRGVVRTAVFVGGQSTAIINNSRIEAFDGTFLEDYTGGPFKGGEGVMIEVPWILGLTGNCRATQVVGSGTAYYNNTRIKVQGWGALSTDAVDDVKLHLSNCTIEAIESGYGAYAEGNSLDTFSGCTFNVPDYGLIMTQGSALFTDGTVVNSGRFGVMGHSSWGTNTLTIDRGTIFNTQKAVIQLKASDPALTPDIIVDNAELNSDSGIILQSIATDNPLHKSRGKSLPPGDGPIPSTDVNATFSNMTLKGDIINGNTANSHMNITFNHATITGAVTTSITGYPTGHNGGEITMSDYDLYYLMGEVTDTYSALPDDPKGLTVTLDSASTWIVDTTSYLTELNIAEGAKITASEGCSLTMTVDGFETPINAGVYKGIIVLLIADSFQ